ncbi:MAG: S8 family serine peptidase [Phycisphaeraceae bacterium]|nr:S8 family serine peptidase [Phycisphaeraceae bacterium]
MPFTRHIALIAGLALLGAVSSGASTTAAQVAAPAPAEQPLPEHYYYVFDTPTALTIDPRQVAVQRSAAASRAAINEPLSRIAGVAADAVEMWPIPGWSIGHLDTTQRSSVDLRQMTDDLADDPSIEFASPVFIGADGGPIIVTQDLLVQFDPSVSADDAEQTLAELGAGVVLEHGFGGIDNACRVRSLARSGFDVLDAANRLAQRDDVVFAEPDMIFTGRSAVATPNDALFASLWGLDNTGQFGGTPGFDLQALQAWDLEQGDSSIVVVVIDNGVQQDHPDINQRPGADFTTDAGNGGPVNECDKHGTAVAGCVSSIKDNMIGVAGIAPGCRVASARCMIASLDCSGGWTSQSSWTVSALNWASSIGARVTNNSNGYGFTSSAIGSKYQSTRGAGMVHFASSMNDGASTIGYPASLAAVNAVGSIDPDGLLSSFSNYGTGQTFVAPGRNIETTDRTGAEGYNGTDFQLISGTSFASPYAAGVAALALSMTPSLSAQDVEGLMKSTAMDLGNPGYDTTFGYGLLQAHDAVIEAYNLTPPGPCVADLTGDGVVNTADLGGLLGVFGTNDPYGDINGDGVTDTSDLGLLIAEFGRTCP